MSNIYFNQLPETVKNAILNYYNLNVDYVSTVFYNSKEWLKFFTE